MKKPAAVWAEIGTVANWGYIRDIGLGRWLWRYPQWQATKRLGRQPIQVRLPHGLAIRVPRGSQFSSALFLPRGFIDWGSELALVRMMPRGSTLLDVGAHFGYYSLIAAAEGMHCVAFEPDPRNEPLFREATAGVAGIELRQLAMAEAPGSATLLMHRSSACSRLTVGQTNAQASGGIDVQVTTVDEVVGRENLPVAGIKIDVEGFDRQVLVGALHTLRTRRPVVCTESVCDKTLMSLAAHLGYVVGAFVRRRNYATSFSWVSPGESGLCPMLFLVPVERRLEMLQICADITYRFGG